MVKKTASDRRATQPLVDALISVAAWAGLTCIVLAVAGWCFGISIVLFRTGSMAPEIPAGSAALVREIPARDMQVGDIVTVTRDALPPITHRVTEIVGVTGDLVEFRMQGDDNDEPDPERYVESRVDLVVFAVPGVAPVIAGMGNPLVLGGLTVAATGLVAWAFWPRNSRDLPAGSHAP